MRTIALLAALSVATPTLAQQRIDRPGPVAHQAAGTTFPERIGALRRIAVVSYAADGRDLSANYVLDRGDEHLLVSVYIYPATPSSAREQQCRTEFEGVGQAILQAHPDARRIEEGSARPPADVQPNLAHRAVYEFRAAFFGRQEALRSETRLYCYVGGDWLVKYRVSSTTSFPAIDAELERLIANGPWPGRAAAAEPRTVAP